MTDRGDSHSVFTANLASLRAGKIVYVTVPSYEIIISPSNNRYARYCIHVYHESGFRRVVLKRYSEFKVFFDSIKESFTADERLRAKFPPKQYIFNLSKNNLVSRRKAFSRVMQTIFGMLGNAPKLYDFLGLDASDDICRRVIQRTCEKEAHERCMQLLTMLGQGSFGKVFLVRPLLIPDLQANRRHSLAGSEAEISISSDKEELEYQDITPTFLNDGNGHDNYASSNYRPRSGSKNLNHIKSRSLSSNISSIGSESNWGDVVDLTFERVYAMKVLVKAEVAKRKQIKHTLDERDILAFVHHPNIVNMRYAFQTSEKLYMITDFCKGGELFFHLKKMRRFTEAMVQFYVGQIAYLTERHRYRRHHQS
jgi:hypothetical protein